MQTMLIAEEPKDSCQDICGEWRELPCSCDPKCLVFSNCCEDFEVECSGIVEESKSNYAGLEHSEVDEHPIIFNNKYCAQCNGFTNVSVFEEPLQNMIHNSDFEVLMSLSRETIDLERRNLNLGNYWDIIQCKKSGNQDLQCDVICPTGLVFRPYKECKMPLSLQIAISTNIILPGKTDVKIWTDYVHCFLTQVLEVDIETVLNYSKVDRFYNIDESFYWIEMIAYEKGSVFKPQIKTIRYSFDLLADSLSKIGATTDSKNLIFKLNSSLESIKMCGLVVDIKQKLLNPNEYDDVLFCRDIFLTTGQETVKTQNSCHIQFSRCSSIHFFLFYFPIQLSCLLIVSFFLNS
nr:hypothetical protein BgiMline_013447 [Biomphalaria glabrata]